MRREPFSLTAWPVPSSSTHTQKRLLPFTCSSARGSVSVARLRVERHLRLSDRDAMLRVFVAQIDEEPR